MATAALMKAENVSMVNVSEDVKERFSGMMGRLDYVVLVIILCAGALAFIVLYNLNNINITERIREIVGYILTHFDQKTKRNSYYTLNGQRLAGFNSIFAVSSIPAAMKYYVEFQKQLAKSGRKLTIATISVTISMKMMMCLQMKILTQTIWIKLPVIF